MDAYSVLLQIEVALRELIISELSEFGAKWWKQRLPGDIVIKVRQGREYERMVPWRQAVPHHPIYYTDLPDLTKVITARNNWDDKFSSIFGNAEHFRNSMRTLEPIRNSVAHSRIISTEDLEVLRGIERSLVAAFGEDRFHGLIGRRTAVPSLMAQLRKASEDIGEMIASIEAPASIDKLLMRVNGMRNQWWWDEDYLGFPTETVDEAVELTEEYCQQPRNRWEAYRLPEWVQRRDLIDRLMAAKDFMDEKVAA